MSWNNQYKCHNKIWGEGPSELGVLAVQYMLKNELVSNKQTLINFKNLSTLVESRPEVPFLIASSLLIPGYIDIEEVDRISKFIAELNPSIPYRLLGFHPHHLMIDLPRTSKDHAMRCMKIAQKNGLKNISIGNIHLLSDRKYSYPSND